MNGFSPQQIAFLAILLVALGLLVTERLRNDVVALLVILSLYVTGVLEASEALFGFGSEPAVIVAAIFVLSGALHQTGLSERIGEGVRRLAGSGYSRALVIVMLAVALLSAFTHHLTTTAVMLPVTLNLSRDRGIPASKLLMPLSFAASLGTTITIIGAPAFLIASSVLQQAGRPGLAIFSIAPIGLALSVAGTLFMLMIGRFLLPARRGAEDTGDRFRLEEYTTELTILPDSPYVDKTVHEVEAQDQHQLKVVDWLREGRPVRVPPNGERIRPGDVLLVRTTPEDIVSIRQERGLELHPVSQYGDVGVEEKGEERDVAETLVQAVVSPGSDLVGRTIGDVDFRRRYGVIVVGLWRREGWIREELARVRLGPGDVFVLQGDQDAIERIRSDRAFLMLVPFHGESRMRRKAPVAGAIMLGTIAAAGINLVSVEMATLAGAVAMILAGCLTARQAYRSIDSRIYVFIAGAVPLGAAMTKSGTSQLVAGWLQSAVGGWSQALILFALFAIGSVITQFLSDAATTAVFAPVAVALAQALGRPPEPFVVTVAMAAVASFLAPIGHHGNLLVYAPGRYRFSDFAKVGTPLTLLVALLVVWIAPLLWPG